MDKIKLEQQTLESLQGALNRMGNGLDDAASKLKKIDISKPAGGDIFARLSAFRFSLLDLTLADEAVELVLKAIGVIAGMAANKTRDIGQRVQNVMTLMEGTEGEVAALIGDAVCDPEGWHRREAERAAAKAAERQAAIDRIVNQMKTASPPEKHFAITAADKLASDGFYQFAEGFYSLVTGDWENIGKSDATRTEFLMVSLLQSCAVDGFEPFDVGDLMGNTADVLGCLEEEQLAPLLKLFNIEGLPSEAVGPIASLSAVAAEDFVDYINQMRLINSLDESAVLSMADSYINSDNPCMQEVGHVVKELMEASPFERAQMITKTSSEEAEGDLGRTSTYEVVMTVLGVTAAAPIEKAIGISGAFNNITMNTGNNAELTNNMIYASEASRATYSTFQADLAAYEANPTDANLDKAMTSYQNYYRTMSISYDAYGAYVSNSEDSLAGQFFWDESAKNADNVADHAADNCRNLVTNMDKLRSEVPE